MYRGIDRENTFDDGFNPLIKEDQHPLRDVFDDVIRQVSQGKGNERHGKGKGFYDQPWVDLTKTHGIGFLTGQAEKKLREAVRNMDHADGEWVEKEIIGALAYLGMAVLFRRNY